MRWIGRRDRPARADGSRGPGEMGAQGGGVLVLFLPEPLPAVLVRDVELPVGADDDFRHGGGDITAARRGEKVAVEGVDVSSAQHTLFGRPAPRREFREGVLTRAGFARKEGTPGQAVVIHAVQQRCENPVRKQLGICLRGQSSVGTAVEGDAIFAERDPQLLHIAGHAHRIQVLHERSGVLPATVGEIACVGMDILDPPVRIGHQIGPPADESCVAAHRMAAADASRIQAHNVESRSQFLGELRTAHDLVHTGTAGPTGQRDQRPDSSRLVVGAIPHHRDIDGLPTRCRPIDRHGQARALEIGVLRTTPPVQRLLHDTVGGSARCQCAGSEHYNQQNAQNITIHHHVVDRRRTTRSTASPARANPNSPCGTSEYSVRSGAAPPVRFARRHR